MLTDLMSSVFCFPESPEKLAIYFKMLYEKEIEQLQKKNCDVDNDEFSRQLLIEFKDPSNNTALKTMSIDYLSFSELVAFSTEENIDELELKNHKKKYYLSFFDYAPQEGFSAFYALTYRLAEIYLSRIRTDTAKEIISRSNRWQKYYDFFNDRFFRLVFESLERYDTYSGDSQFPRIFKSISPNSFYIKRFPYEKAYFRDVGFYCQELRLVFLLDILSQTKGATESLQKKEYTFAAKCAALAWGERLYSESSFQSGFNFSLEAIDIDDPSLRRKAFNLAGVCAIENGQLQWAYDVYLSWICKCLVLESTLNMDKRKEKIEDLFASVEETQYREKHPKEISVLYGNFAYVCGTMYDNLDPESTTHKYLVDVAEFFIKKAIELNPESESYYCSAGTIFSDDNNRDLAIEYYLKYQNKAHSTVDRLTAERCIIDSLLEKLFYDNMLSDAEHKLLDDSINLFVQLYNTLKDKKSLNDSEKEEYINGREMYSFFNVVSNLSDKLSKNKMHLLLIRRVTRKILCILRRSTYSVCNYVLHYDCFPDQLKEELKTIEIKVVDEDCKKNEDTSIAYYTKLSRLENLFDAVECVSGDPRDNAYSDKQQNRFTVMHERYMNDPEEGLTLLNRLSQYLPNSPTEMRDELLDQKYVFLKSFTGLIDTLNMWTLYGSDKENGQDCNGCCVCISPDTFDLVVNNSGRKTQPYTKTSDDYRLYRVAYMNGEKIYVDGVINKPLTDCFRKLKKLLSELKEMSPGTQKEKEIINNALIRALEKIMFLFKEYAYNMEKESRLILTREMGDESDIQCTSGVPKLLFVSPPFQVFIEKIILGPKLSNPDLWTPILQKELYVMSNKWPGDPQKKPKPIVRKSSISIRD